MSTIEAKVKAKKAERGAEPVASADLGSYIENLSKKRGPADMEGRGALKRFLNTPGVSNGLKERFSSDPAKLAEGLRDMLAEEEQRLADEQNGISVPEGPIAKRVAERANPELDENAVALLAEREAALERAKAEREQLLTRITECAATIKKFEQKIQEYPQSKKQKSWNQQLEEQQTIKSGLETDVSARETELERLESDVTAAKQPAAIQAEEETPKPTRAKVAPLPGNREWRALERRRTLIGNMMDAYDALKDPDALFGGSDESLNEVETETAADPKSAERRAIAQIPKIDTIPDAAKLEALRDKLTYSWNSDTTSSKPKKAEKTPEGTSTAAPKPVVEVDEQETLSPATKAYRPLERTFRDNLNTLLRGNSVISFFDRGRKERFMESLDGATTSFAALAEESAWSPKEMAREFCGRLLAFMLFPEKGKLENVEKGKIQNMTDKVLSKFGTLYFTNIDLSEPNARLRFMDDVVTRFPDALKNSGILDTRPQLKNAYQKAIKLIAE